MTGDALNNLHTALLDTREGYEVAEKDAESPAMKALFADMIALRSKEHEEIHRVLTAMGGQPDDSGSIMATVHKTVTSVRAAVTGLDEDALSPFIDGEKKILEKYDAAIDEADANATTRDMLIEQQATLMSKVAEMEALKSA